MPRSMRRRMLLVRAPLDDPRRPRPKPALLARDVASLLVQIPMWILGQATLHPRRRPKKPRSEVFSHDKSVAYMGSMWETCGMVNRIDPACSFEVSIVDSQACYLLAVGTYHLLIVLYMPLFWF